MERLARQAARRELDHQSAEIYRIIEEAGTQALRGKLTPASARDLLNRIVEIGVGESLVEAAEEPWKGMILGGYYTGARLRDLSNLKWESVDLQRRAITFVQGKTKHIVEVPLHPEFQRWLEQTPPTDRKSLIFPSLAGTANESAGLSAYFRTIIKKAKVEGMLGRLTVSNRFATNSRISS